MSAETSAAARPKCPYPGLRPFEAEEWSIFFGRERMIDDVIDRLAAHRLVLIHGASGAGKSSLVRAGVLPKLARQHRRAGAPWQTCTMRPSGGPLWNLAKELARLEGTGEDAERVGDIVGRFNRRGATLSAVADSLKDFRGKRICILVDQFEELFRFEKETSREEAELFVDLLVRSNVEAEDGGGADGDKPSRQATSVHVVVTMRSEFLGECSRFSGLAETINRTQYLVPRMERDALLRAIRRPAQLYGGEVTLNLAERLITDAAGREDELPLIQHGLMYLWNAARSEAETNAEEKLVLDSAPLEQMGGLAKLLSGHADSVLAQAAPDAERYDVAERLFRALTDLNIEGKAIRRPQAFRDLVAITETTPETLRQIIEVFRRIDVSFLTPYAGVSIVDDTSIDISHEALIRCWSKLADQKDGWLRREFDDGLIWRSLLVEAREFQTDKRRILSPATSEERSRWWLERKINAAWTTRYGDNFPLVRSLMDTSRKNAWLRRQIQYGLVALSLIVGCAGGAYTIWTNQTRLEMLTDIHLRRMVLSAGREVQLRPKQEFRECSRCPVMVVIPAGEFAMGSDETTLETPNEGPQHRVAIAEAFAASKYEVTFEQWDTCYELGGCTRRPEDLGWGRGNQPVISVSWNDAQEYVAWLSRETGRRYRLLSEAEWEYASRAGENAQFSFGDNDSQLGDYAWYRENSGSRTHEVGQKRPNAFGLHDMHGNAWEWAEDCYAGDYANAPTDGSARTGDNCDRVIRGGSWFSIPEGLRSTYRSRLSPDYRGSLVGFRIGRTLAGIQSSSSAHSGSLGSQSGSPLNPLDDNLPRKAEDQAPVEIVQVIRAAGYLQIRIRADEALRDVCWWPADLKNAQPKNDPYVIASGYRYRLLDGDNIAYCPARHSYRRNETMVLRFEPLEPDAREFSLVEGKGGEDQMIDPASPFIDPELKERLRYWNFLHVRSN